MPSREKEVILSETTRIIHRLCGEGFNNITVERLVVGVFFTGVKLSNGRGGISYTPTPSELHGPGSKGPPPSGSTPYTFKGRPVKEVLDHDEDTLLFTAVKVAVLNALSEPFISMGPYTVVEDRDALDLVDLKRAKEVAMVGAIIPFLSKLRERPDIKVRVIEKRKENLRGDDRRFYVPASRAAGVLPLCDTVIITGASVANGTLDRLLSLVKRDATVIVTGPTVSFVPDALFGRGVDLVSGIRVLEPEKALDMLSEGMTAYHLFDGCVKKVNILKKAGGARA